MAFKKFFCSNFLLREKCILKIFKLFLFRLIHYVPLSSTLTSFRRPIPTISHFKVSPFDPDTFRNLSQTLKTSLTYS